MAAIKPGFSFNTRKTCTLNGSPVACSSLPTNSESTTYIRQPSTPFGSSSSTTFVRGPTPSFGGSFSSGTSSSPFVPLSTFSSGNSASQNPFFNSGTSLPGNVLPQAFDQQQQQTPQFGQSASQQILGQITPPILGQIGNQIVKGVNKWQNKLAAGINCAIAGVIC